jgi:hypothetical protein
MDSGDESADDFRDRSSSSTTSNGHDWLLGVLDHDMSSESSGTASRATDTSGGKVTVAVDSGGWDAMFGGAEFASFEESEDSDSIPLPAGLADGAPAAAKRQRSQPVEQHSPWRHSLGPPQQPPAVSKSGKGGVLGSQPTMRIDRLSYRRAWSLMQAPTPCSGPRPAHLSQVYTNVADMRSVVFKEPNRIRRKQRTDQWLAQGGPNGSSCEPVAAGVSVRRKYGKLTLRNEDGEISDVLRYHEYRVELDSPQLGSAVPGNLNACKLFHILPTESDQQPRASVQSLATHDPADTAQNGQRISGLLTLQMVTEAEATDGSSRQPRWIKFDDAAGREMGSIGVSESGDGVVISSGAGDFAEWHPKVPGERLFEQGDVVGFCPPPVWQNVGDSPSSNCYYITLATGGAKQLGIISRKAVVQGSEPKTTGESNIHCSWDTVAYCGRVPVKLIGSARAGDILVPSGYNDGTAVVQTKGNSHIRLGVVEHDVPDVRAADSRGDTQDGSLELLPLSQAKDFPWQLVHCSVVAPSNTVSSSGRSCNRRSLATMLVLVAVWSCMYGWRWLRSDGSCPPIEPFLHGILRGGCDGTVGSTCHVACDDNYYAVETLSRQQNSLYQFEGVDAPLSEQALNPVGGILSPTLSESDSGAVLQFPACSSCFLTDGLMCQPQNRSGAPPFPVPLVPPPRPRSVGMSIQVPSDPYDCASDVRSLQACQPSTATHEGGTVCFAPFDGYEPCELCSETGPSQLGAKIIEINITSSSIEAEAFEATGYAAEGLACEDTARGIPWSFRVAPDASSGSPYFFDLDEHTLCSSFKIPAPQYPPKSFQRCKDAANPKKHSVYHTLYVDDIERRTRLCVPLQRQQSWREHWQDEVKQPNGQQNWRLRLLREQANDEEPNTGTEKIVHRDAAQPSGAVSESSFNGEDKEPSAPARQLGQTRHCKEPGRYTGSTIQCVRYTHCPSETLGALRNQACRHCAGKEAVLLVPRTSMLISSHGSGTPSSVVVAVPCPAGFYGHVNRTCARDGWVDEAPLAGECIRKRCLGLGVRLAISLDDRTATHNATVLLPSAVEGSGRVFASCPNGYAGNVSAVCAPDADRWSDLQIRCHCTTCGQR